MGQLRINPEVDTVLTRAMALNDVGRAFSLISTIAGIPAIEENVTAKYSSQSGLPTKFQWIPYKNSDQKNGWELKLWYDTSFNTPSIKGSPLAKTLEKKFRAGRVAVLPMKNGEYLVFENVPQNTAGGGTTPPYIRVRFAEAIR